MVKKRLIQLIAAFLISFLLLDGMIIYNGLVKDEPEQVDYIVILGAGLRGEEPSLSLLYRLQAGLNYANKHQDTKIILSGGQGPGETITEAEAMQRYLLNNGVAKERIILEDRSTSTFENMKYSKEIIEKEDTNEQIEVMIVTNDFHMLRSKMLAERQGFKAYGLPAKTPAIILPKVYLREYFAFVKSFLFDF